jgi:hypothetical protein
VAWSWREYRGNTGPELPVLLATDYSQYAAQVVKEGFALVEKPYRRDVLAASLRAAVERVSRVGAYPSPSTRS